jgi:tetratricopeptide (TPR) repeat protein
MAAVAARTLDNAIQRAEGLAGRGDWHGAVAAYRVILQDSIRVEGNQLPTLGAVHLLAMDRFADLAVPLGYIRAGRELLSAMASLSSAAGDWYGRDYACVKRMLIEVGVGDLSEANATLRSMESTLGQIDQINFADLSEWESRRSWPRSDASDRSVLFSQLYLAMGALLASLGSYGEALQSFRRGLAFTGQGMPDLAQRAAPVLHASIAAALLEKGDLGEAEQELDTRIAGIEEFAEPALYLRVHEVLAKLCLLRGEFGRAESELQRIVRICSARAFDFAECRARLNLAQMLIFLNKTSEAQDNLERAVAIARSRGDQAMHTRAAALMAAGRARVASLAEGVSIAGSVAQMWLGEPEPASSEGAGLPASVDLPQAGNALAFFEDRLLAAHWQLARGSVSNARTLLAEMRQTFQHCDSLLIEMRLDAFEALLCYYEQNYQAAATSLRRLLPIYAGRGVKPELWQLQRVLGWCLARMNAARAEQDQLTLLSKTLLEEITSTLAPQDQAIYELNKWTSEEEYFACEIDSLAAAQRKTDATPAPLRLYRRLQLARRLHALSQRIDRFKEEIAGERVGASSRTFVREQLAQPRDTATLKFLVLPDRVLVIERTRFHLRFGVSSVSRLQLRSLVRAWHEWTTGLRSGGDFQAESAAVARDIGAALQINGALGCLSSRVKSLRIIPDDCLHGFPFAVLKYRDKCLVEGFALSIHASDSERARHGRQKPVKALFVGVSAEAPGFPALTLAGEELPPFRAWTREAQLTDLRNAMATRDSVVAELQSCTFAHIACHGVYVPKQPEATGLVLVPSPPDHEVLSMADIASLRLEKLRHLTLSACWSADNFLLPGRWVVSFPQRFHVAGAGTVLACLWEVEQRFAAAFFARYYSYLAELPPAEALARTQQDCISNTLAATGDSTWMAPIYWAGYRVYGGRD